MSPFRFVEKVRRGQALPLNGDGKQSRDFTYIDDIARGTLNALKVRGFHLINLGGNKGSSLMELIKHIERNLGKKARIKRLPALKVDMRHTRADISKAKKILSWSPAISLSEGIKRTVTWHLKNASLAAKADR